MINPIVYRVDVERDFRRVGVREDHRRDQGKLRRSAPHHRPAQPLWRPLHPVLGVDDLLLESCASRAGSVDWPFPEKSVDLWSLCQAGRFRRGARAPIAGSRRCCTSTPTRSWSSTCRLGEQVVGLGSEKLRRRVWSWWARNAPTSSASMRRRWATAAELRRAVKSRLIRRPSAPISRFRSCFARGAALVAPRSACPAIHGWRFMRAGTARADLPAIEPWRSSTSKTQR